MRTITQSIPLTEETPLGDQEFQTGQVLTIVGGHFIHDTFSAFVSPLLPLIIEKLSLSLTSAGGLWSFLQIPALLTPFIGYMADKVSLRYFVIFAPAATATLMSLLGFAPNYWTLACLLLLAGISVSIFHAPAPAMVGRLSGRQLGRGMSFFMAGGELGRSLAPLLAVWVVSIWTLDGFYRIMVLGWAASLILYWRLRDIPARTKPQDLRAALPAMRRLFVPLVGIIIAREFLLTSLTVFLPTFRTLSGASLLGAGASLAMWELAGVGGALLSGSLSDRLGRRRVLLTTMLSSSLLVLPFLYVNNWLLTPILLLLGFTALAATPVLLAIIQEQMPHNRAMANGVFMSLAFVTRPMVAFVIGFLGDNFGLGTAFFVGAVISLLAVPLLFTLPEQQASQK